MFEKIHFCKAVPRKHFLKSASTGKIFHLLSSVESIKRELMNNLIDDTHFDEALKNYHWQEIFVENQREEKMPHTGGVHFLKGMGIRST